MKNIPNCPECGCEYVYPDGHLYVCPDCFYEWNAKLKEQKEKEAKKKNVIRDKHGNKLNDGDNISIIKDLKVNGSSNVLKRGTIVKNIKLIDGDHNIDCKINGFGAMKLKSEFVKKL